MIKLHMTLSALTPPRLPVYWLSRYRLLKKYVGSHPLTHIHFP